MKSNDTIYCTQVGCEFSTQMFDGCLKNHCKNVHQWGQYPCVDPNCEYVGYSQANVNKHRKLHNRVFDSVFDSVFLNIEEEVPPMEVKEVPAMEVEEVPPMEVEEVPAMEVKEEPAGCSPATMQEEEEEMEEWEREEMAAMWKFQGRCDAAAIM